MCYVLMVLSSAMCRRWSSIRRLESVQHLNRQCQNSQPELTSERSMLQWRKQHETSFTWKVISHKTLFNQHTPQILLHAQWIILYKCFYRIPLLDTECSHHSRLLQWNSSTSLSWRAQYEVHHNYHDDSDGNRHLLSCLHLDIQKILKQIITFT